MKKIRIDKLYPCEGRIGRCYIAEFKVNGLLTIIHNVVNDATFTLYAVQHQHLSYPNLIWLSFYYMKITNFQIRENMLEGFCIRDFASRIF